MLLFARYVIPVSAPHIENGGILVRDGKIADIGDANTLRAKYPGEEFRDFGIAALMPGFIDTHTHLEYSALRGLMFDVPYAAWKMQLNKKFRVVVQEPKVKKPKKRMTWRELVSANYPDLVDPEYVGGIYGCPGDYAHNGPVMERRCGLGSEELCNKCWDQEVIE